MKTQTVELEESLKLWKKSMIDHCIMDFSCGGDSMNEFTFVFYDENKNVLRSEDIETIDKFFEEEVFDKVDFYVNSDGHYLGEFGTVHIELNNDGDDFEYSKDSSSEYSESVTENFTFQLTDDEYDLLSEKISDFNGDTSGLVVNYNLDCIITDKEINTMSDFENKILNFVVDVEFEHGFSEAQEESENFECNVQDGLNENKTIELVISRSYYVTVTND
jgi:hypothetical protein